MRIFSPNNCYLILVNMGAKVRKLYFKDYKLEVEYNIYIKTMSKNFKLFSKLVDVLHRLIWLTMTRYSHERRYKETRLIELYKVFEKKSFNYTFESFFI